MDLGLDHCRWKLASLLEQSDFLSLKTVGGLHQVLKRLGISLQRARSWIHSPDQQYDAKLAFIRQCIRKGQQAVNEVVFLDEFSYSIHPTIQADYAPCQQQPKAQRAIGYEKTWRILAAMNCFSGQVHFCQRAQIKVPTLIGFFKDLVEAYPQAETIYVILDNWPVHFHVDVIDALQKQDCPFAYHLPKLWQLSQPSGKYTSLNLPIQLVPLPTYASWLNPIEKLWKWLKKDLIHHHPFATRFDQLKQVVQEWMNKFEKPNQELLAFTGLLKEDGIFADALFNP